MDIEDCNGRSYMSGMPSVCSLQTGVGADSVLWMKAESLQPWPPGFCLTKCQSQLPLSAWCLEVVCNPCGLLFLMVVLFQALERGGNKSGNMKGMARSKQAGGECGSFSCVIRSPEQSSVPPK